MDLWTAVNVKVHVLVLDFENHASICVIIARKLATCRDRLRTIYSSQLIAFWCYQLAAGFVFVMICLLFSSLRYFLKHRRWCFCFLLSHTISAHFIKYSCIYVLLYYMYYCITCMYHCILIQLWWFDLRKKLPKSFLKLMDMSTNYYLCSMMMIPYSFIIIDEKIWLIMTFFVNKGKYNFVELSPLCDGYQPSVLLNFLILLYRV